MTWTDGPVTVHVGDALAVLREMPAESVHCVVTSPPYWGLRDYGVPGQLGLESTPEEYVCRMVEVFGEVRRVLRSDGTLWCNMGDGYAANVASARPPAATNTRGGLRGAPDAWTGRNATPVKHPTKPKDLVMMPARLALALQADGWWLRSDIIWAKPNPMPESVTDRPTTAHEHVFLLARSGSATFWTHRDGPGARTQPAPDWRWAHKRTGEELASDPGDPENWQRINLWRGHDYFYDAEAVREAATGANHHDLTGNGYAPPGQQPSNGNRRSKMPDGWDTGSGGHGSFHRNGREPGTPSEIRAGRNLRSVWTIATQPYPEAHFATFPEELARRCIAAGTSERGCCPECGAPWRRVLERTFRPQPDVSRERGIKGAPGQKPMDASNGWDGVPRGTTEVSTTGWQPTCAHDHEPAPATVLDPFAGSGTTLAVARRMGRRAVGIELQADYLPLIRKRVEEAALPLLESAID